MGRRIGNTTVHVHDEDGLSRVYGPGDTVPDEDVALITNPKVWADAPDAEVVDDVVPAAPAVDPPSGSADPDPDADPDADSDADPDADGVWVIVNGDMKLGDKSRWLTPKGRGKPVEFATADEAQARLEEILPEHPEAHIEKLEG